MSRLCNGLFNLRHFESQMRTSALSRFFRLPNSATIAFQRRDSKSTAVKIGHALLDEFEERGHVTNLREYVRKGELYSLQVIAGRIPFLVLQLESNPSGFELQAIYPAIPGTNSEGDCLIEVSQGLLALSEDTAVYWQQGCNLK